MHGHLKVKKVCVIVTHACLLLQIMFSADCILHVFHCT